MRYKRFRTRKKPQARRKVVSRATKLDHIRVNNTYKCCIPSTRVTLNDEGYNPNISGDGNGKWKKTKRKEPKSLQHAHWMIKDNKRIKIKSELRGTEPLPKWSEEKEQEWLVNHKIAKWEKRHPRPVKDDDLFKEEFLVKWNTDREQELSRIRAFVSSRYDKAKTININNSEKSPVSDLKQAAQRWQRENLHRQV